MYRIHVYAYKAMTRLYEYAYIAYIAYARILCTKTRVRNTFPHILYTHMRIYVYPSYANTVYVFYSMGIYILIRFLRVIVSYANTYIYVYPYANTVYACVYIHTYTMFTRNRFIREYIYTRIRYIRVIHITRIRIDNYTRMQILIYIYSRLRIYILICYIRLIRVYIYTRIR
jgi:hypothetical protein